MKEKKESRREKEKDGKGQNCRKQDRKNGNGEKEEGSERVAERKSENI